MLESSSDLWNKLEKGDHKVPIVSALQDESLGQITAIVGGMVSGIHKDTAFVTCEL